MSSLIGSTPIDVPLLNQKESVMTEEIKIGEEVAELTINELLEELGMKPLVYDPLVTTPGWRRIELEEALIKQRRSKEQEDDDPVHVLKALDLVVEACSQWRNLQEPLGAIIATLNKLDNFERCGREISKDEAKRSFQQWCKHREDESEWYDLKPRHYC